MMPSLGQPRTVLVTGGCGFIGSHFIRHALRVHPTWAVVNMDKLTYAADPANLADVSDAHSQAGVDSSPARYRFIHGDVCDSQLLRDIVRDTGPASIRAIVHFAAETHVDRSIEDAGPFVETNVLGTQVLLEAARSAWTRRSSLRQAEPVFLYVSTDEVYGPSGRRRFDESSALRPTSPYAASKASADLLCQSYGRTYHLPVIVARLSNQYGPNQLPEKLIPKAISKLVAGESIPIYGRGEQKRSWLFVEDTCLALEQLICRGKTGEIYNIGGGEERNLDLIRKLTRSFDQLVPTESASSPRRSRIRFVVDPRGAAHDSGYAMDGSKIEADLGWSARISLEEGLHRTVAWYLEHPDWLRCALRRLERDAASNRGESLND